MSNGDTPPAKRERCASGPKNITAHTSPLATRRAQTSGPDGNCLNFIIQLSPRRFLPRGALANAGKAICNQKANIQRHISSALHRNSDVVAEARRDRDSGEHGTEVLVFRISWRSRKWDSVAHVRQSGDVGESTFESETKPGVRDRAVATQITIPSVVRLLDAALRHPSVQHVEPLFALAAANDLADTRSEHVHCCDRSAVVVHSHIEGFNILWVVHYDHGPLDVLLSEVALML